MTFDEIVDAVAEELNLTTTVATTRIGKRVNSRYKRVTSSIGMTMSRRTTVQNDTTPGVQTLTFSGVEKINTVRNTDGDELAELSAEEILDLGNPPASDEIGRWAPYRMNANTVQIILDVAPQSAITLYAEGFVQASTLTGSQEPAFAESFHDILIFGAIADELRKKQQYQNARMNEQDFERRLGELRLFIAASKGRDLYQGKHAVEVIPSNQVGSASGSSFDGTLSWTQTGLVTFSRGSAVPFAVAAGAARVPNLRVDTNFLEVQVFS